MLLTTEDFPTVMKAIHTVDSDSGGIEFPVYTIPEMYAAYLPRIEEALKTLSEKFPPTEAPPLLPHVKPDEFLDSEFYNFCNGEGDLTVAISNRNLELQLACVFLNDHFDDFYSKEDPLQRAQRSRLEYLDKIGSPEAEILRASLT